MRAAADIRNPLASLPAAAELAELPAEVRGLLRRLLREASAQARERGEKCWKTHKAPMAAYWKAWAVNFRHASVLLGACREPSRISPAELQRIGERITLDQLDELMGMFP